MYRKITRGILLVAGMVCLCLTAPNELKSTELPADPSVWKVQKESLVELIRKWEEKYNVLFTYDRRIVESVEVEVPGPEVGNIDKALEYALQKTELKYTILENRYVVLYRNDREGIESLEKMIRHLSKIIDSEKRANNSKTVLPLARLNTLSSQELFERRLVYNISGIVTDQSGDALIGVNILVSGTNKGTATDFEGNFSLEDLDENDVLIVSYIGYVTQEIPINGRRNISIILHEDAQTLDEVVVTAFGINKTKSELTYSTQEVDGSEISQAGNPNMLNGLQGKVAGVNIDLTSGMPGRSPLIKIRGSRSFTGGNQPLFVIDGAPVSGRIIDINPSDVETVNILKGPAASALYGMRASNGVVVITTKTGETNNGAPTISFDSYYSIDQVSKLPDLQLIYAQGADGVFNNTSPFSWGPRIDDLGIYVNQFGEEEKAASYDNDKQFYQDGATFNANLAISNANDKGSYYFGIGYNKQNGIVPGSELGRANFKFNGNYFLTQRFSATLSFNFSYLDVNDYPDLVGNANYFRSLTDVPPSYNLAGTPYSYAQDPYRQTYFRSTQNNPYWVVNHNYRNRRTPRTIGNILLNYKINEALSINYRFGADNINTRGLDFRDIGTGDVGRTNPPSGGLSLFSNSLSTQLNSNLFLTYLKEFDGQFSIDAIVGNELFDLRSFSNNSTGQNFVTGGWADLANATEVVASNSESRQRIAGLYANVNLGWQDKIFINASGRNDYVSNMPEGKRSFFYPSIGSSAILTNLIPGLDNIISFGKLRATFAEVGQAGRLFVNGTGLVTTNPGGFLFPFNGLAAFTQQSTRISPDLEPENTRSFELGADIRFLDDRIGLDYTYYQSISIGQIFNVPLAYSTGASSEIRNAGKMSSKGHEIILTFRPVRTKKFKWDVVTNFTTMDNKALELAEGIDRIDINSSIIVAEKGYDYPSILGKAYFKDPVTGKTVVQSNPASPQYGMPILDPDNKIIGTTIPDFEMNFINNFSYNNLTFSFQLDWRSGGQLFSQSYTETRWRGLNEETIDRDREVVIDGVKGFISNGNLVVEGNNDIAIKKDYSYYTAIGQWHATEESLQDASFMRLRELTINYDLPKSIFRNIFFQSASFYLTGRNLLLITDSFTDPEVVHSDGRSSNTSGLEWSQIPQTKSIGAGIRFEF